MTDEKREDWEILPPSLGLQPDGGPALYPLRRIRCPEGHERDLTLAEQNPVPELPCHDCGGTMYPIDWNKRDDDDE